MDIRKSPVSRAVAVCALLALAACGETVGQQAIGGGVVGAGVAAVADGNMAQGAAIGAAANVAYCQTYPERC
ncbi:hypothetical protein [Marivita hallyeonensis]|uniref:hypothetical protein n=1 Tax=Marivita hallyeonensis TaxID=996342 RepID=UPI000934ACF3|nr:hypothetical protein [Marivita hallyeonensis]